MEPGTVFRRRTTPVECRRWTAINPESTLEDRMPATRQRSLYHGWVVLAFFLIAGALSILGIPLMVADLQDSFLKYILVGAGSAIGGFSAGWTCPHPRMNEVGAAAVAVVVFMVALVLYAPVGQRAFETDTEFVLGAIAFGSISLVFSLGGAFLGDRIRWTEPRGWRVLALSTLFAFGTACVAMMVVVTFLSDVVEKDGDTTAVGIALVLVALAAAALASGAMTQAAVKSRIRGAAGFGPIWPTLSFVVAAAFDKGLDGDALGGTLFIGMILYGFARWGASITAKLRKRSEAHIPPAVASD